MSGPKLVTTTSATNPNAHDLELDARGQLVWAEGSDLIPQRLKCRWMMMKGEWYMDQRLGTPWLQSIFRKGITTKVLRGIFELVAKGTPGVKSVSQVSVEHDRLSRTATISYSLKGDGNKILTSADLDVPFIVPVPEVRNG